MGHLTMSRKEAPRAGLLRALVAGKLTLEEVASALGLSERQVRRLLVRYRSKGAAGLGHRNRGKHSKRRMPGSVRRTILGLMKGIYAGLNDCHLTEKLREVEGIAVSRAAVRRLRIEAGVPAKRRRRAAKHRRRRERAAAVGALVQIDGSLHRWLGAHTAAFTLLGAVDDASGALLELVVRPNEDLHGYVRMLDRIARTHGLPGRLYGDRSAILVRNDKHWSLDEELKGRREPTQFGRMLADLGVGFIPAKSPQAKGRVENRWGLLQDRLVQELRLLGVKTIEQVEPHLPAIMADLNRRFGVEPRDPKPAWRAAPRDLGRVLACRYMRKVRNDDTVSIPGRWIQLPARDHGRSRRGRTVELRELLDGTLEVYDGGRLIVSQPCPYPDFTLIARKTHQIPKGREHLFGTIPAVQTQAKAEVIHGRPSTGSTRPAASHPWKVHPAVRPTPEP
jgi:transposase